MSTRSLVGTNGSRRVAGERGEHRFFAYDLALEIARALVEPLKTLKAVDAENCDQAYRSLKGMCLCVAEGGRRRKLDRANFFDMAAGSAQELRMALTLAVVFGHLDEALVHPIDRMIDRELAMLWALARRTEADVAARRTK